MRSLPRIVGLIFVAAVVASAGATGCGNDDSGSGGGGIGQGDAGRILVKPVSVTFERTELGTTASREVVIENIHPTDPLTLFSIGLKASDNRSADDLALADVPEENTTLAAGQKTTLTVEFTAHGQANAGVIEVVSSDPAYTDKKPLTINVYTLSNDPFLRVDPSVVRFPRLPPGETAQQMLTLRNDGSAPLVVDNVSYSGGSDFRIDPPTGGQLVIAPSGEPAKIPVHYAPRGNGGDRGEILIESNDTSGTTNGEAEGTTVVDVLANADGACILVDGTRRNFGQVPIAGSRADVVKVTNCGAKPLELTGIALTENTADNEFSLDINSWDANGDGQFDAPVTIARDKTKTFEIDYEPIQVGSDTGAVVVSSNDPVQPSLTLNLVGRGSDGQCPQATVTAKVRGGGAAPRPTISAVPLDYVVLDGSRSSDPDGRVVDYEWTTLQLPDGAQDTLGPTVGDMANTDASKRQFRALLAGTYKYGLEVTDNAGFISCDQAVATIVATPDEKIHVELTWTNPEDPDESDDSGSDVDVHFAKMGPAKWFESPYDIYFRNSNSGAGGGSAIWNPESPSLDIDDTNGGGPENIQMDDPGNCEWYAVGVHYYRQLFGTAYATLRIYINEDLRYEQINKPLQRGGQFWDVARIHWDQGKATVQNVDDLRPTRPVEQAPQVTAKMSNSGLCTTRGLY